MSESKHTPTPWKLLPEEIGRDYIRIRGTVLGGRYKIANVLCPSYKGIDQREIDETRANANRIVHCVNTYDDLVDALEHAKAELNRLFIQLPLGGKLPHPSVMQTVAHALDVAKERQP